MIYFKKYPNKKPSFFGTKGDVAASGINQAGLGSCWFLAANAAVAERPERMKRIFGQRHYTRSGAFRFYFWSKN